MRSLDCARDDRMIVSEEFSDNLPHIYFAWGRIAHFHIACHIPEEVEPRTSESFQLRTLNSFLLRTLNPFLPHTLGNRGEVELWVTADGSPKGEHLRIYPLTLTSTSKGSNHTRPRAYVGAVACFAFSVFFHARLQSQCPERTQ